MAQRVIHLISIFVIVFATFSYVSISYGVETVPPTDTGSRTIPPTDTGSHAVPQTDTGSHATNPQSGDSYSIINPFDAKTIPELIIKIIDVLLEFAKPIIVLYIMYAGFKFVTAQGNPGEIESARTSLTWAIVGGVIVFAAQAILEIINQTITKF